MSCLASYPTYEKINNHSLLKECLSNVFEEMKKNYHELNDYEILCKVEDYFDSSIDSKMKVNQDALNKDIQDLCALRSFAKMFAIDAKNILIAKNSDAFLEGWEEFLGDENSDILALKEIFFNASLEDKIKILQYEN